MTIQDTIPKHKLRSGPYIAEAIFERDGMIEIYVDEKYNFMFFAPRGNDRYYFRIKLKPKK
jgi:hypothetical protein